MNVEAFLAQLNTADKEWGLWVNRDNSSEYHVGHYAFENDRMPKSFVHVGSLDYLAHLRQQYIKAHWSEQTSKEVLSNEWAENFLNQWQVENSKTLA